MIVCTMNEIYIKYIGQEETNGHEWNLKQLILWAQVSQLTFTYLLRLAITPYWP